jgi:hypothetical protein
MNYLSVKNNLCECKYEMFLKTRDALFHAEVKCININPMIEIDDENLIRLRDFLNLFFPKKEPSLNENS